MWAEMSGLMIDGSLGFQPKITQPKHFCPIVFFVNFVAFSEYVNFSFVLQKFHRVVSFENVDAIRVNWVINSKGLSFMLILKKP